jgi:hypothetical protein
LRQWILGEVRILGKSRPRWSKDLAEENHA